jgi:hypothetical protein
MIASVLVTFYQQQKQLKETTQSIADAQQLIVSIHEQMMDNTKAVVVGLSVLEKQRMLDPAAMCALPPMYRHIFDAPLANQDTCDDQH